MSYSRVPSNPTSQRSSEEQIGSYELASAGVGRPSSIFWSGAQRDDARVEAGGPSFYVFVVL